MGYLFDGLGFHVSAADGCSRGGAGRMLASHSELIVGVCEVLKSTWLRYPKRRRRRREMYRHPARRFERGRSDEVRDCD